MICPGRGRCNGAGVEVTGGPRRRFVQPGSPARRLGASARPPSLAGGPARGTAERTGRGAARDLLQRAVCMGCVPLHCDRSSACPLRRTHGQLHQPACMLRRSRRSASASRRPPAAAGRAAGLGCAGWVSPSEGAVADVETASGCTVLGCAPGRPRPVRVGKCPGRWPTRSSAGGDLGSCVTVTSCSDCCASPALTGDSIWIQLSLIHELFDRGL